MSDDNKKPVTLPEVLWLLANLIFKREAVMFVLGGFVLLGLGGIGVVWAQDKLDGGAAEVRAELQKHVDSQAEKNEAQARFNDRVLEALQKMEDRSARRFDALQNTILERREQPEARELAQPAKVVSADGGVRPRRCARCAQ